MQRLFRFLGKHLARPASKPLPPPPQTAYFPQELCDALNELREVADYTILSIMTTHRHPEYIRVQKFAEGNNIPLLSILDLPSFRKLEENLAYAIAVNTPREKQPYEKSWCLSHGQMLEDMHQLFDFLSDERKSASLHEVYQKIGRIGLAYNGPNVYKEIESLITAYNKASRILKKTLQERITSTQELRPNP